jgi:glycosyltransferase involved in cell wall biosynthesis
MCYVLLTRFERESLKYMKIAIIASIWISVPPQGFGFGAQEYLAYYIAEGMKRKGHDVTLFATADSTTSGTLVSVAEKQVIDIGFPDPKVKDMFELINVSEAYRGADKFDIIHNHLLPYGLLFASWSKTPTVHTLHHHIYRSRAEIFLYERYKKQNFVSISNAQRNIIPELNYIATIYNGVDCAFYQFKENASSENYLLYIGRLKKYKGIHTAINLAKRVQVKLKIATPLPNISQPDYKEVNDYWEQEIKPKLGENIEYVGEMKGQEKVNLLGNAKALIVPFEQEEPFGMTLIEAMSCGTPVITYAAGAIPEIIIDGNTGYEVPTSDSEQLLGAIARLYSMPEKDYVTMRKLCRAHVETNFSIQRMIEDYDKLYNKVLSNEK